MPLRHNPYTAALLALLVAACGAPPPKKPSAPAAYAFSVDFLQVAQGQCRAVATYRNRHAEPLRISGDVHFHDAAGRRVANVALVTDSVPPGGEARETLSLLQIYGADDERRCRSIAGYRAMVASCRTGSGHYLESAACAGESAGELRW